MFEKRAYLLDVTRRCPTVRTFRALVDVLANYRFNEFYLYRDPAVVDAFDEDEEPVPDTTPKMRAYCELQGLAFHAVDPAAWERVFLDGRTMTVSTEAPRSLAGRVEEMRERMEKAEAQARDRRLERFVVTDFSDGCDWQPLAVSLPGIVLGGSFAAAGAKSAKMDLELELNRVFDAPVAGLLLKLGTLYLRGGALRADASEFFNILNGDCGYSRHPGLTQIVLDEVSGIAQGIRLAAERWVDRTDWAKEIAYAARLVDAACHRRDEARLRALRDEHGRIWRLRFEPRGRISSLSRLPRF